MSFLFKKKPKPEKTQEEKDKENNALREFRAAQMAKVDAKGKAEADYFFKLRADESAARARNGGRPAALPTKAQIKAAKDELFDPSHGSSGIRFDDYAEVPVQRSGPGEEPKGPAPLASFDDLKAPAFRVPPFLLANVARCGYSKPTPIQAHCVPLALNLGNDLMSCAQTGSGKTCAFLLPVIAHLGAPEGGDPDSLAARPSVVVMAPTRELAIQIHHEARRLTFDESPRTAPEAFAKSIIVIIAALSNRPPGPTRQPLARGRLGAVGIRHRLTTRAAEVDQGLRRQRPWGRRSSPDLILVDLPERRQQAKRRPAQRRL